MSTETENNKPNKSSDLILIDKILNNDILKQKVELWSEEGVINLVHPEWKSVLNNQPLFQKYQNKQVEFTTKQEPNKHYIKHYIKQKDDQLQVLVAGYFRVISNTSSMGDNGSVTVVSCPSLDEIGKVLCNKQYIPNTKLYINSCGGICPACRPNNIQQNNLWCIKNTQVFTKEGIHLATRSYIETVYKASSMAIANIEINMTYDFSNMSKIGGRIKSICFIQECLLRPEEEHIESEILSLNEVRKQNEEETLVEKKCNTIFAMPEGMELKNNEPGYEVTTTKLQN